MTYNLAIGDRTYSSWSLRGWLCFAKFDIPVQVESARMYTPEFLSMLEGYGGGKLVPAVSYIDGGSKVVVTDTLAIAETLAERHPEKNLWPADPAARGYARSITAQMHSGFANLRNDCTMNLRHCYKGFEPSDAVLAEVAQLQDMWAKARKLAGNGPWLFGEYSIADAFYAPVATRLLTHDLPVNDMARKYIATTINDPAFKQWRSDGLAEGFVQPGYDLDLETVEWPNII